MIKEIIEREWIALEHEIERVERKWHEHYPGHRPCKRQKVKQVLIAIFNNQKFIIMSNPTLKIGFSAPIVEGLVDAITLQPIPGATKVAKSKTVDNPAIATIDANGNLVPVAIGTVNVTDVNTWTYTDQNTQQVVTADETTTQGFDIVAGAEGVLQVVSLGAPVAIVAGA